MSKGEVLFSPKSLVRVVRAVEWEDDLVVYRDGSSNQGRFMEALALLWGRWISGESLPSFVAQVQAAAAEDWVKGFEQVIREMPAKVLQFVGFYRGLGGAFGLPVPKAKASLFGTGSTGPFFSGPIEERVYRLCEQLIVELASIIGS